MSGRTRRLLTNIALLLLSVLISLTAVEGLLRIFSAEPVSVEGSKPFVEYDPLLGWRKIPNLSRVHTGEEYEVHVSYNSRGIRGPEYSYDKADAEYRILVLGASFAEGRIVEFNELVSEVLKRELNNNGDQYYEVINAGTYGYCTGQELLFFQNEGKKYSPDLTILMFHDYDVWHNSQPYTWRTHKLKPLFQLENGNLVLTNVPVPETDQQPAEPPM